MWLSKGNLLMMITVMLMGVLTGWSVTGARVLRLVVVVSATELRFVATVAICTARIAS